MEQDGNDSNGKRKRSRKDQRVPSSASCSSASSTNSPPEKKCGMDNILQEQQLVAEKPVEFCKAVGRPDTEVERTYGIPNKIIVRKTATASHVLLMGTTSFMLNPLLCPYGERLNSDDVCKLFRAAAPRFMKDHLEGHHAMSNVLINLVCPYHSKSHDNKRSCAIVKFAPYDGVLGDHVMRYHNAYYKEMQEALCRKNLGEVDALTRIKFPSWIKTERLFPSQIIPDKIVSPTVIKDNKVHFICHMDGCQEGVFSHPTHLHCHLMLQHGHLFGSQTRKYHSCPAENCTVQEYAAKDLIISHVAAMHPELVGRQHSKEVQEKCIKYENQIVSSRMGMAVTNTVQTEDDKAGIKRRYLEVYRCPVENCYKDFLGNKDHLIWHIRDHHAQQWSSV